MRPSNTTEPTSPTLMSLSRILNDEPSLPPSTLPTPTGPMDSNPLQSSTPPALTTLSSGRGVQHPSGRLDQNGDRPPDPRSQAYQPRGNSYFSERDGHHRYESTKGDPLNAYDVEWTEGSQRKRKLDFSDDSRKSKRHVPRRLPTHQYKTTRRDDPSQHRAEESAFMTDDERLPHSSDLEECPEIWFPDLNEYKLDTQRRQKQVEIWFNASVLERNSNTAQYLSQHYSDRIARLPSLSRPPSLEDDIASSLHLGSPNGAANVQDFNMTENGELLGLDSNKINAQLSKRIIGRGSDAGSDFETSTGPRPLRGEFAAKKRRLEKDADLKDEWDSVTRYASKNKGKGKAAREKSPDSVSTVTKGSRKRASPKKKLAIPPDTLDALGLASASASASADMTPNTSRPPSPTMSSSIFYELDQAIPPLKRAKKIDDAVMFKRMRNLEEAQRKVWYNIARRDVAKVYRYLVNGSQARVSQLERVAKLASTQARRPFMKTAKGTKDKQAKAKRLMREMLVTWKKNEREERDVRKREQKEALDRAKVDEEKREAARQARKLEFLISQTELYSHFVSSKLRTSEVEGEGGTGHMPATANIGNVDANALQEIDFDNEDTRNLHLHAKHNAQEAVKLARERVQQFDTERALERKTNEAIQSTFQDQEPENHPSSSDLIFAGAGVDLDSDELNFQNPSSLSGDFHVKQPRMLMAQLKEYQLKGLNWLATLYEQGINGILADEMGLGKTVQSISLLAYLAEVHDIWGPFLVVAPASTLHNWQQEICRFVPGLKALPYWGNVKDRAILRKFWSKKQISYNKDAPFHILITSYQLVTQDQQYFQRVKWQYMILDEAQNIKNSSSVRWKTLLGFHCRNRLLLTGTPIQNNMQELWALLHFIMPSLFDSHDEFNEWFSKDIENAAAENKGKLNERQLRRLHMILKPFMLRRVKRHVQNELTDKIQEDIYVDLTPRQSVLYKALLANVSVSDLLEKAANLRDAESARSLMNLVMQFRKVCNHPELFERADVVAPFSCSCFGQSGSLIRESDFISLPYSARSPIEFSIPALFYQDGGLIDVPCECVQRTGVISKLMNIWNTSWMYHSIYDDCSPSSFAFLRLLDLPLSEACMIHESSAFRLQLLDMLRNASSPDPYTSDPDFVASLSLSSIRFIIPPKLPLLEIAEGLPDLSSISASAWTQSCLSRPALQWFIPSAVAPPIILHCMDRSFLEHQALLLQAPLESMALYGLPLEWRESEDACAAYQDLTFGLPPIGLFANSPSNQLPSSTMRVPDGKRLIYDSAKLARLDSLLQTLKAGEHRVLIYFQMTRMMDLMEEYLIYRQYRYLRLDGSSKLEDRRDMVIDWQTRPDIFVFLLSTRAGGLGINLTAADTVVFYDHDWNPSNDAQAMDRAHRLGQTRQVTVYRLITRGTIDERIVQMARVKKDVQDIVVGNKHFTDVAKPSEIVQLLLNDEQLAGLNNALPAKQEGKQPQANSEQENLRDLWNEEGDDFFNQSTSLAATTSDIVKEDDQPSGPPTVRKKRGKGTGGTGSRKHMGSRSASSAKQSHSTANHETPRNQL